MKGQSALCSSPAVTEGQQDPLTHPTRAKTTPSARARGSLRARGQQTWKPWGAQGAPSHRWAASPPALTPRTCSRRAEFRINYPGVTHFPMLFSLCYQALQAPTSPGFKGLFWGC